MARRSLALLQQEQHCRYHHPFIGAEAVIDLAAGAGVADGVAIAAECVPVMSWPVCSYWAGDDTPNTRKNRMAIIVVFCIL